MRNFDIETPDSQAAAEAAEEKAIIDRAMCRPNPSAYLAKLFRISPGAGQAKRDRLSALLAQRIEEKRAVATAQGLSAGGLNP